MFQLWFIKIINDACLLVRGHAQTLQAPEFHEGVGSKIESVTLIYIIVKQ